jgi:hypothetical protein
VVLDLKTPYVSSQRACSRLGWLSVTSTNKNGRFVNACLYNPNLPAVLPEQNRDPRTTRRRPPRIWRWQVSPF